MNKRPIDEVLADVALEADAEPADADDEYVASRVPARAPAQVYSVRIPVAHIERLRTVAQARGVAPTALMRDWIVERLAAEDPLAEVPVRLSAVRQPGSPAKVLNALRQALVRYYGAKVSARGRSVAVDFSVPAHDEADAMATAVEWFTTARRMAGLSADAVGLASVSLVGSLRRGTAVQPVTDVDIEVLIDAIRETVSTVVAGSPK